MSQTQIILIVVAVLVIAVFYWRSKREEKSVADRDPQLQRPRADALMGDLNGTGRVEPALTEEEAAHEPVDEPAARPPVYEDIVEEHIEEREDQELAEQLVDDVAYDVPPVDSGIEWVLEVEPQPGKSLAIGGIKSLVLELRELSLPLDVKVWACSTRDGKYYQGQYLTSDATHLVVAVVLANRAAGLDELNASRVYQAVETIAALHEASLHTSIEIEKVPEVAQNYRACIKYFDRTMEIVIEPINSIDFPLTLENVGVVAEGAGFTQSSGRWEYHADPESREPLMTLSMSSGARHSLSFVFDVPVANMGRGDFRRYLLLANHIANHLNARWVDVKKHPIDAGGAMLLEDSLNEWCDKMRQAGIPAGSDRAYKFFARGA